MDPTILGFVPNTESYEDVGEIPVWVQDLETRWTFEQERNRDFITSAQAAFEGVGPDEIGPGYYVREIRPLGDGFLAVGETYASRARDPVWIYEP